MKTMKRTFPLVWALAIALGLSASLAAAEPQISVTGGGPWNTFTVLNADRMWFQFERKTCDPDDSDNPDNPCPTETTMIPMILPAAGATFTIDKAGSPCVIADPGNCTGSDVSVPDLAIGTLQILDDGGDDGETPGTAVFTVKVEKNGTFGTWLVQPTTNASITAIRTIPRPEIAPPAEVLSAETGVTLDASASKATYEPSGSAPPLTFGWTPPAGITLSSSTDATPTFDAPAVTSPEDLVFALTVTDDPFEAQATPPATVTVVPSDDPVDAVLLLDTSGSMKWHRLGRVFNRGGGCCSRLASAKSAAGYFLYRLHSFTGEHDFASASRAAVAIFSTRFAGNAFRHAPEESSGKWVEQADELIGFTDLIAAIGGESGSCDEFCYPLDALGPPGEPTEITAGGNTPTRNGIALAYEVLTNAVAAGDRQRIVLLLSDGAYNTGGDPLADTALFDDIENAGIHIYTVGMGTDTDNVNHSSLEQISARTGVGTAAEPIGFTAYNLGHKNPDLDADPDDPDPEGELYTEPNLVPHFEKILTDMLNLEFVKDPEDRIVCGETPSHRVVISDHDQAVSFTVSWESSRQNLLDFVVRTPDGTELEPEAEGSGRGYKSLQVPASLLRAHAAGEWQLEVRCGPSTSAEELPYNYSVIARSNLNMRVLLDKGRVLTGDELVIEARLIEDNRRLRDGDVKVTLRRPESALGNWHYDILPAFREKIADYLKTAPGSISGEALSRLDHKNHMLWKLGFDLPETEEADLELNDQGRDGDRYPGDGIYAATLKKIPVPGIYEIKVVATGEARNGQQYRRERTIQKFVDMVADKDATDKEGAIESFQKGPKPRPGVVRVSVTPFDKAGNYLGPGYDKEIKIALSPGTAKGPVEDLLYGAYQQRFDVDDVSVDPNVVIDVRGVEVYDGPLSVLRRPRHNWELSLHAGWTDPQGAFDQVFDGDFSVMVDFGYRFTRSWSAELLVGNHGFSAPDFSTDVLQVSVNAKYSYPTGLFRFFTNGGFGHYDPDLGGSGMGWNAGAGVIRELNPHSSLELSFNYHEMTEGLELEFSTLHLGFRRAF